MDRGYFKMWRMWFDDDSPIWPNEPLVMIMVWCCKKATHKKRIVQFKTGKGEVAVSLEPGQLIFGRHKVAKQLKMNPETLRKRIAKLKALGFVTMQSTSQYSILSICNYKELNEKINITVPSEVPGKYQASTTKKTLKTLDNLDNLNKKPKPPIVPQGGDGLIRERFDKFINLFPNSVKRSEAWTAWQQLFVRGYAGRRCTTKFLSPLTDDLFSTIMEAVEAQIKERAWKKEAKVWIASWTHPATWLRSKRWEDKTYPEPEATVRKFEFLEEE